MYKIIIFIYFSFIFSEIPINYYESAEGLIGENLKIALHEIIDNHNVQSYGSLHDHFESTDRKFNNTVWDMYSDNPNGSPDYVYNFTSSDQCGNYSGEGDCYNKEHSWPKSWFNNASPMNSDLFHLYPTDGYVNSHRGNYPYGDVGSPTWISTNGSKKGSCSNPGYSGIVFEPIDEYKGDFARTYFYMSTRYYNEDSSWDNTDMTNGAELKEWAVSVLLYWHQLDPVSDKEINRNEEIYLIQGNRNPFIDHPEWVECIWTNDCVLSVSSPKNKYNEKIINSFNKNNSTFFEIEFETHQTIKIEIYNLNGKKVVEIFNGLSNIGINHWKINHSNISSGIYFIQVQTPLKTFSEKFTVLN